MRLYMAGASFIAYENYSKNSRLLSNSLQRLSSGLRINSASDDPSGLAIADNLRTQASSISQGIQNANSAIALTQIADKAMSEQSYIIDIIKSKLIQASTDTTSDTGRESIRKDIVKYLEQLDNIASQTNYDGIYLLQKNKTDDSISDDKSFQTGAKQSDIISLEGVQSNTNGLNLNALKSLTLGGLTKNIASSNLKVVDDALSELNLFRAEFGSTQNQLESSVRFMMTMHTNLKASESVIRDVDYAKEFMEYNRLSIMVQAGMFAMSQANKVQEQMLRYLFK